MRRAKSLEHADVFGTSFLNNKKCVEGSGEVRFARWEFVSRKQAAEAIDRAEAALNLEEVSHGALSELCQREGLVAIAECVGERLCADEVRSLDGNVRITFVCGGL